MPWWVPLVIFIARVGDVSIGTVRTILVINGARVPAALLGVIEVTIWVLAVSGVLVYLPSSPWALVGYALGFGAGVLVGMVIEDRLALGYRVVRVITTDPAADLAGTMRDAGFPVTAIRGQGRDGPVDVLFMVILRRDLRGLCDLVRRVAPDSFLTVERADRPVGGVLRGGRPTAGRVIAGLVGFK